MSELLLVKQASLDGFSEAEKDAVRRFLFQTVDGLNEQGKKGWRGFWRRVMDAELGEVFRLVTRRDRSGKFHRFHMAMEQAIFDNQERFAHFDTFRTWLKIGAGWCEWAPGPKGGIVPIPKSTSYADCDEDEMRDVHDRMVEFLRTAPAQKALWPHLKAEQRSEAMELLLREFDQ